MWSGEEVPVFWRDTFYDFQTIWHNILENYDCATVETSHFTGIILHDKGTFTSVVR